MPVYAEVKGSKLIRYPYTEGSLMEENPFTNYGSDPDLAAIFPGTNTAKVNGYSLKPVTFAQQPTYDESTQVCSQDAEPRLINGVWTLGWTVSAMTPEQRAAWESQKKALNKARAMGMLRETDWVELPSVSNTSLTPHLVNYDEFINYRCALRAIAVAPSLEPVWPTEPTEEWSS